MARPRRSDSDAGWYHVMNRGIAHGNVFFADPDRIEFGERLRDIFERFGIQVHAYCLMDNHYHLLVHCPNGQLSAAMQRLGSLYTRHVNDRLGRDGAIFRGRFHSRVVDSDAHLLATARYIHRNALDLPGVDAVDAYRWSSHRTYLGHRRRPDWLFVGVVLELAGGARAFHEMVTAGTADDSGSSWTPADVARLVDAAAVVLAERAATSTRSVGAYARSVVVAWAADQGTIEDRVVADALGITGPAAWRSAVWRARSKARSDPDLDHLVERSLSLLAAPVITRCSPDMPGAASRLGSDPIRDQRAARAAS